MKKFAGSLATIVALFVIIGGLYSYDSRIAKKIDVAKGMAALGMHVVGVEFRLDQKIVRDDAFYLQREIWKIENQYGTDCLKMPPDIRDRYRKMQYDLKKLEKQLDQLEKRKANG